jgi:thiamine kinase-like enzyme
LSGGLLGRCYRVTTADVDYAVRLPAAGTGIVGALEPRAEAGVLQKLHAAGLAPRPVLDEVSRSGLVVTEYLSGASPWSAPDARRVRNIRRLAARLRALHRVDAAVAAFDPAAAAESYISLAKQRQALGDEQRRWCSELSSTAQRLAGRLTATCLCHNDLVASNILDDGELWFVDLEYAVLGAPLLDLAGFAGMNALDDAQCADLLTAYYADATPPFTRIEFARTVRFLRLLAYFWLLAFGPDARNAGVRAFAGKLAAMLR